MDQWDEFRREDLTIDLVKAWEAGSEHGNFDEDANRIAIGYLEAIEALHPITSRQVAALAIATATMFVA